MWLCLKVCFLLLLVCSYSKAEDLTTGNILDPADTWTIYDRASTEQCSYSGALEDGEVCTGSANQRGEIPGGGGIISQDYSLKDQGLSVAEMQQDIAVIKTQILAIDEKMSWMEEFLIKNYSEY